MSTGRSIQLFIARLHSALVMFVLTMLHFTLTGCATWQVPVSYTHLTLPTMLAQCRCRWSPGH